MRLHSDEEWQEFVPGTEYTLVVKFDSSIKGDMHILKEVMRLIQGRVEEKEERVKIGLKLTKEGHAVRLNGADISKYVRSIKVDGCLGLRAVELSLVDVEVEGVPECHASETP